MTQHFLLSAKARTLSLVQVMRLSDDEAFETFRAIRWADNDGDPVCPRCGSFDVYTYKARRIFKWKGCKAQFSVTTDTIFASRKLPRPHYAFRGELTRIALDALRDATEPKWTGDIAKRVIAERGLPADDKAVWRATTKGVGRALREQRKRGTVRSMTGPRSSVRWELRR